MLSEIIKRLDLEPEDLENIKLTKKDLESLRLWLSLFFANPLFQIILSRGPTRKELKEIAGVEKLEEWEISIEFRLPKKMPFIKEDSLTKYGYYRDSDGKIKREPDRWKPDRDKGYPGKVFYWDYQNNVELCRKKMIEEYGMKEGGKKLRKMDQRAKSELKNEKWIKNQVLPWLYRQMLVFYSSELGRITVEYLSEVGSSTVKKIKELNTESNKCELSQERIEELYKIFSFDWIEKYRKYILKKAKKVNLDNDFEVFEACQNDWLSK